MKIIVKTLYLLISIFFILYLLIPNQEFPKPPPDSVRSFEPADVESTLRRAYYTNFSREEVMKYYVKQLENIENLNPVLPTYRLNYPPEEAQVLIRDQTRSTFLEEIVHPFRESFYISGFEPKLEKDEINVAGKNWRQKITIRSVPSTRLIRVFIALMTICVIPFLYKQLLFILYKLKRLIKK